MADKKRKESGFEIMDNMMLHLDKTKNLFLIMILTVLILPPIAMLVVVQVIDPPFESKNLAKEQIRENLGLPEDNLTDEQRTLLKETLDNEKPKIKTPQLILVAISLAWLGIGIRQWIVIRKWSKKYREFRKEQDEVDKRLEDDNDD